MRVGIIEYGGEFGKVFQEEVAKQIETISFQYKKALDVFDVLAFAKKMSDLDHVVIIVQKDEGREKELDAFYDGLANLEAETGKNIFKCIYDSDEGGEDAVKELADKFVKAVV